MITFLVLFSNCEIDFQTARQVNNRLKEPRRLKKDTMAQTSINTFFIKKEKPDGDSAEHVEQQPDTKSTNGTTADAHNAASASNVGPKIEIKNEKVSDDEVSDTETVINSPPRVKDEPFDAYDARDDGHGVVPKTEPNVFPPSDDDTDVEMDIDQTLVEDFDPTVRIKIEPEQSKEDTVASILRQLRGNEAGAVNATETPANEQSDVVNPTVVKNEPEVYPPSDEATDDEMDIDPTLATEMDPTVQVKTEPISAVACPNEMVASILRDLDLTKPVKHQAEVVTTTESTSKSVQSPSKRKREHQLEKDSGKKPRVDVPASIVKNRPSNSVASRAISSGARGRDTKTDKVVNDCFIAPYLRNRKCDVIIVQTLLNIYSINISTSSISFNRINNYPSPHKSNHIVPPLG